GVRSSRQDEFSTGEPLVDFPVQERPWPVLEAVEAGHDSQELVETPLPPHLKGRVVTRDVLEAPVSETDAQGLRSSLVEPDADDFHEPVLLGTDCARLVRRSPIIADPFVAVRRATDPQ